ncbi:hypothetical protein Tco_1071853, partial [Tanacetum coccineum]
MGFKNNQEGLEEEEAQMESLLLNDTNGGDPLSTTSSPNPNSFNSFLEPPFYVYAVFRSFDHGNPTRSFPRQLPPCQLLLVIMVS